MSNRFSLSKPETTVLPRALQSAADGQPYPIDPDFHTVLACLRRLGDPDADEMKKRIFLAARFFLGNPPPDYLELFSGFLAQRTDGADSGEPLFDFEQDAGAIYASFRSRYGLNLLREPLHWFEFRELLAGLDEQTPFGARVRLRAMNESDVAPEDRPALRRLKAQVALRPRVSREERELIAELDRRLAAGESPDDVLAKLHQREE